MWLIWPAPGSVGRAARNLEILREPELIKPHVSQGPDHWSVRGRGEKLAIELAGGWPLREILDNFRQLSVDWNATIKSKLFPFTSQWWWETLIIDCPNSKLQTISFNNKKATANNCSSIPGQRGNWHLNKLNARSDSMIPNLFWINSGEALIGTGLILSIDDWRLGFTLTLQLIMDT